MFEPNKQHQQVWNEVIEGIQADGAHNFLTGAGGFLQSILGGYAGLKVRLDGLHIDRPRLPANVRRLWLTGEHNENSTRTYTY